MNGLYAALDRSNRLLEKLLGALLLALLAFFFFSVLYQILNRNIPALPNAYWTEELSRFAFQWMVLLGTAVGVLRNDHFVLEAFPAGSWPSRATTVLRELALLGIALVFVLQGYGFGMGGLRRTSTAAGLPMIYVYMGFTVCGVLMLAFCAQRLLGIALFGVPGMRERLDAPGPAGTEVPGTDEPPGAPPGAPNDAPAAGRATGGAPR